MIRCDTSTIQAIGSTIGRYRVIRALGSGGMGEVYLAEDSGLHRNVALKILTDERAQQPEWKRRFVREAITASKLTHPNVAVVYDAGETEDGRPFISLEYIEGETLRDRLARGALPIDEAVRIATQVADALDDAHRHGIVHRDIKPANIVIDTRGRAKILDFGIAKLLEPDEKSPDAKTATLQTQRGVILGTAQYMSPEQVQGDAVDHRTDIFSFGVVLYEMLIGTNPFAGGRNFLEVARRITETTPDAIGRRDCPQALKTIVARCLEKDQNRRYQTARDLVLDLERVFESDRAQPRKRSAIGPPWVALVLGVIVLAVILVFSKLRTPSRAATRLPVDSIAVLPFVNANADAGAEYLSEGVTESIINNLSQLSNVRVMARSTMFSYKGKRTDPREVARQLNVRGVVAGSLVRSGDELNVSAELVDGTDGSQIWGSRYRRKVTDAFAIQEEIAREIAENLRVKLTPSQQSQLRKRETENAEAYELYLQGRFYLNRRTASNFAKAIDYFQRAVAKDPRYALAYAGLGDTYSLMNWYTGTPALEAAAKARAAATKALEIDPSLAEAHTTLGAVHKALWEWADAEHEYKRAIELKPNYAFAHQRYSVILQRQGRFEEALAEIRKAQQLDPLSPIIAANIGNIFWATRRYPDAFEAYKAAIRLDPDFGIARMWYGRALLDAGHHAEAFAELQKSVELTERSGEALGDLGYAYGVIGDRDAARKIVAELIDRYREKHSTAANIALVYFGLGERASTHEWLKKAYEARDETLPDLAMYPTVDALRNDPTFVRLATAMGLKLRG